MAVSLIVGGYSEKIFFEENLHQCHRWSDLGNHAFRVVNAKGDANIPTKVQEELDQGNQVVVLFDYDSLFRKGEQAMVISNDLVRIHDLDTDFEGVFDPAIVSRALNEIGYKIDIKLLVPYKLFSCFFWQKIICKVLIQNLIFFPVHLG